MTFILISSILRAWFWQNNSLEWNKKITTSIASQHKLIYFKIICTFISVFATITLLQSSHLAGDYINKRKKSVNPIDNSLRVFTQKITLTLNKFVWSQFVRHGEQEGCTFVYTKSVQLKILEKWIEKFSKKTFSPFETRGENLY